MLLFLLLYSYCSLTVILFFPLAVLAPKSVNLVFPPILHYWNHMFLYCSWNVHCKSTSQSSDGSHTYCSLAPHVLLLIFSLNSNIPLSSRITKNNIYSCAMDSTSICICMHNYHTKITVCKTQKQSMKQ